MKNGDLSHFQQLYHDSLFCKYEHKQNFFKCSRLKWPYRSSIRKALDKAGRNIRLCGRANWSAADRYRCGASPLFLRKESLDESKENLSTFIRMSYERSEPWIAESFGESDTWFSFSRLYGWEQDWRRMHIRASTVLKKILWGTEIGNR